MSQRTIPQTSLAGVVITPAEILDSGALEEIRQALEAKGIDLEELFERVRNGVSN